MKNKYSFENWMLNTHNNWNYCVFFSRLYIYVSSLGLLLEDSMWRFSEPIWKNRAKLNIQNWSSWKDGHCGPWEKFLVRKCDERTTESNNVLNLITTPRRIVIIALKPLFENKKSLLFQRGYSVLVLITIINVLEFSWRLRKVDWTANKTWH